MYVQIIKSFVSQFSQEILNDFEGMKLDYYVLGYGKGGTLSVLGRR